VIAKNDLPKASAPVGLRSTAAVAAALTGTPAGALLDAEGERHGR
jgi:hypothetical protein